MKISELPSSFPVFPLAGVLLLPRGQLPLNIFEPRYLQMLDDALGRGRYLGMIQPMDDDTDRLAPVGCLGRISSFSEAEDGRMIISVTGVCRFSGCPLCAGRTVPGLYPATFAHRSCA